MAGSLEGLNLNAMIAEFVADGTQSSLELPRMSAGQRKQAKKLLDQHPEITCESYGFGEDRQLHIFKSSKDADPAAGSVHGSAVDIAFGSVSVKNTFIDNWIGAEGSDGSSEPVVFRSMPPRLAKAATGESLLDEGNTECGSCQDVGQDPWASESSPASSVGTPRSTDRQPRPAGDSAMPGLEVRNTFIHFEDTPADERNVQSMPHGMFRQRLLSEAAPDSKGQTTAAFFEARLPVEDVRAEPLAATMLYPPVTSVPASFCLLAPGTPVVIDGLMKCPAFNGLSGTVQSLDEESGRYNILLSLPAGGHKFAKVKSENLRMILPPPPPSFEPAFPDIHECESPAWGQRDYSVAPPLMLAALV